MAKEYPCLAKQVKSLVDTADEIYEVANECYKMDIMMDDTSTPRAQKATEMKKVKATKAQTDFMGIRSQTMINL
jgi:hypothetical protein